MKRVLRSCFDPLPRFMSMKSLACLVAMVVLGTGISVYEYLESARPLERASSPAQLAEPAACAPAPAVAAPRTRVSSSIAPQAAEVPARKSAASSGEFPCTPSGAMASEPKPATPSVWEPVAEQTGS